MPLEDIIAKIKAKASGEAAEILSKAQDQAQRIIAEAQTKASREAEKILETARTDAARVEALAKAFVEAQKRQMVLEEKQKLLSAVFDESLRRLSSMPPEEYRNMLTALLMDCADGDEEVLISGKDAQVLGEGFIEHVNDKLRNLGRDGRLTLRIAEADLGGGVILRKGGIARNLTFPALLKVMRDELEIDVARVLFQ